jgi:predicted TIM-barrel fold metal-dependent hydrolase
MAVVFSGDSHAIEPMEMWERVAPPYRERAPRCVKMWNERCQLETDTFVCGNISPTPVVPFFFHGTGSREEWLEGFRAGWAAAPSSLHDPACRLKEQDDDGVHGELLYPGLTMLLLTLDDPGLQRACFEAYNAWIVEYCAHAPNRLVPIGAISLLDLDLAVRDIERAAASGLRGAFVFGSPDPTRPYSDPSYDRVWAVAAEAGLPLTLHDLVNRGRVSFNGRGAVDYLALPMEIELTLADMVMGGVFERHPKLKIVSAENDVGWIPHMMYRLDHTAWKLVHIPGYTPMPRTPAEYIRENIWGTFTFENETIDYVRNFLGAEHLLWGSDYPHPDSTFPNSRTFLEEAFPGVADDEKAWIVGGAAMKLYGVEAPVSV